MSSLQEQLDWAIKHQGPNSKLVQVIKNQILAERTNKSFRQLYVSRSVIKSPGETLAQDSTGNPDNR